MIWLSVVTRAQSIETIQDSSKPNPETQNVLCAHLFDFTSFLNVLCIIFVSVNRGLRTTVLEGLALREVLKDKAEVSQAIFERVQGQDGGLIGGVQLEDRQQPPAPSWTIRQSLKEKV